MTVRLEDVTLTYLEREGVLEFVKNYDMKTAKEEMKHLEKCRFIINEDCRSMKSYMFQKPLEDSRLEFK